MIEYSVRYDHFARRWLVIFRWPTEGSGEAWQDNGESHADYTDAMASAAAGNADQAQRKAARVEAMASTVACPTCSHEMTYWHGDYYCQPCEDAWAVEDDPEYDIVTDAVECDTDEFLGWNEPAEDADNAHHAVIVTWYERCLITGACVVAYPIEQDAAAGEFVDELWSYGYEPTCTYLTRIQTVALVETLTATLTETTF